MDLGLPSEIASAVGPVFEVLPLDEAMAALVPSGPASRDAVATVGEAVNSPALSGLPAVQSGLWLYVDELDRSHDISQGLHDPTGSFWHAMMHRREGDFWNSKYWYRNAGHHPAMEDAQLVGAGYEPYGFVDAVEQVHAGLSDVPADLVQIQRLEWAALFSWCARR